MMGGDVSYPGSGPFVQKTKILGNSENPRTRANPGIQFEFLDLDHFRTVVRFE